MKKLLFSAAMLFALVFTTSCAKEEDFMCECQYTMDGDDMGTQSHSVHGTEKKATEACEAGSGTTTSGGMTMTTKCAIK